MTKMRGRDWRKAAPRIASRPLTPEQSEGLRLSRLTQAERVDLPALRRANDSWLAKMPADHPFRISSEGGRSVR